MSGTHKLQGTFKRNILTLAVSAAIPAFAMAEEVRQLPMSEATAETEQSYKVDQVSSPKFTQSLVNTPKTITVVPGAQLEDQGITNLNDALRNVSGVSTFGGGEGGGGMISVSDKVTIRGFDARDSIYVDGIRDVAGYSRDTFNIEQLEVVKGASGSLEGRTTGGGSINLGTKHARMDNFGSVGLSYSEIETARVTADYNTMLNDSVAGRVNLLYSDGGDPLDNGVEDYETTGLAGSLLFDVSEKTNITTDVFYMKQDNTPVLGIPVLEDADGNAKLLPSSLEDTFWGVRGRDFEEVDTTMLTLRIDHQLTDDISLRSQTRWGKNEKQSVLGRPSLQRDTDDMIQVSSIQSLDQENELFVTQFDATFHIETGSIVQDLVVGAEYAIEEKDSYGLSNNLVYSAPSFPLSNPGSVSVTGSVDRNGNDSSAEGTTKAIYFFDTVKFSEQWMWDINARYDDYELEGSACSGRGTVTCTSGLSANSEYTSWGTAITFKPAENGSVYVGFSDSSQPVGTNVQLSTNEGNNSLDPQEAETWELGTKWELADGRLLLSAAYYETTKTVLDSEGRGQPQFLGGEQESNGYELGVVGNITDNLSISANFTKLETEVTQDTNPDTEGNGLTAAPDETANIWLTYSAMEGDLLLGGGANYSSGDSFWRQNRAYFETGSYTIASLMAAYQVNDSVKVQLNVDNLFDEDYVTDFSARGHYLPGTPRTAKVSLRYSF